MKYSFFLKNPQRDKASDDSTLIMFTCHFKNEGKQFKYSTGENIKPSQWNFDEKRPISKGQNRSPYFSTIQGQLQRYVDTFETAEAICTKTGEDFTSKTLKEAFDNEFKKVAQSKGGFFDVYDSFMDEKKKRREWSASTIKRYTNIKNILLGFEAKKKYKLTFGKINQEFYTEFLDYCYTDLDHFGNTVSRNIGLIKAFMNWALDERYTYNDAFRKFKKPKIVPTEEVALSLKQVEDIFKLEIENEAMQKVRDIFVFQCLTGMRYSELSLINKDATNGKSIMLKEDKDSEKPYREIPLFELSKYILRKYNYDLPLISNQKQNKYIKDILEEAEFNDWTEYSRNKGKNVKRFTEPLYKRISTHTARRTFITILRSKGIPEKDIMKITGHTDSKSLNIYYKVSGEATQKAVEKAFGSIELPKLKVV